MTILIHRSEVFRSTLGYSYLCCEHFHAKTFKIRATQYGIKQSQSPSSVTVSLPQEWIQGIKRMMTMYFTHGLFLICTLKLIFVITWHALLYLQNVQVISYESPLHEKNSRFTCLEGQLLARGDEFPSTLFPSLVTTAPPLGFYPFHPFLIPQFTLHYLQRRHQQSWSSSSRAVIVGNSEAHR
jgi:hypothetical protein